MSHLLLRSVLKQRMEPLNLINVIPITDQLWLDHSLFSLYTNIYHKCISLTHTEKSNQRFINFTWRKSMNAAELDAWRDVLAVDSRTFKKISENFNIPYLREQGYTVLMPTHVWARLEGRASTENIGRRQSIVRVYCYLYYYSMRFHGSYSHSRGDMMKELKINNNTLAECLAWLEAEEFIIRTDYSMRENERYSRRYYIPQDDWSAQCMKEWIDLQKAVKF